MPYQFIDAYGSVITADSSVISGSTIRPIVEISSFLTAVPTTPSGNQSVSGTVNIGNGSIISFQGTSPWVIQSIAGTYNEDAVHTTANPGLFVLGVRNDAMSSITSADGDYSPFVVGPIGEGIVANAPITNWVSGQTSVMYGPSVLVLSAPGASIFTYITGLQVINESATASRVTITQGLGAVAASMLAWAIAPAGGGSNMIFPNPLKTIANNNVSASISGVSSVYVMIEGFTSKT